MADGKGNELHSSPISSEGRDEGGVFLDLLVELNVAAEVRVEADLDDDEGTLFSVKRDRVGGGSVWDPSCIDEVLCCAMSGFLQHMGLFPWEDPIWFAAWCRDALCVSGGGREAQMLVYEVLGDVGVSHTVDILRRGQGCEPVVRGRLRGWG